MLSIRPTSPPASRHRCRRRSESGPAFYLTLAGFLSVALMATSASSSWMPVAPASSGAPRTALEPPRENTRIASIGKPEAPSRVDELTGVVARRYRVAENAARDVVRAAFREGGRHGLDPLLILAVIAVESRFNPVAASDQGALGLMQVVPRFHLDKLGPEGAPSVLAPDRNIAVGTRILKDSIQRGGSDAAGLQLYNGAFDDETRAYANRVLTEKRRITEALPKRGA